MMDPRKFLLHSLTPILACSLLTGVGSASHKKKNDAGTAATTTQTSTPSAGRPNHVGGAITAAPTAPASRSEQTQNARRAPSTAGSAANSSQIANAKAKGMVWVNTESKVYHTGGKYYGTTKHGQFMSLADAQRAGYKASKR